jgi:hypothetical protein
MQAMVRLFKHEQVMQEGLTSLHTVGCTKLHHRLKSRSSKDSGNTRL